MVENAEKRVLIHSNKRERQLLQKVVVFYIYNNIIKKRWFYVHSEKV